MTSRRITRALSLGIAAAAGTFAPPSTRAAVFETAGWGADGPIDPDHWASTWGHAVLADGRATVLTGTGPVASDDYQAMAIGDINHDGCIDVALGVVDDSLEPGRVVLFYGAAQGWETGSSCPQSTSKRTVQRVQSEVLGEAFGKRVLLADVTGDGYDDLLAAAPSSGKSDNGAVYVFPGGENGVGTADTVTALSARAILQGTAGSLTGWGLGDADDVTGDDAAGDVWVSTLEAPPRALLWPGDASWNTPTGTPEITALETLSSFQVSGAGSSTDGFGRQLRTWWRDGEPWLVLSDFRTYDGGSYSRPDGQVYLIPVGDNPIELSDPAIETVYGEAYQYSEFGYSTALIGDNRAEASGAALWIGAPLWGQALSSPTGRGRLYRPDTYTDSFVDSSAPVSAYFRGLTSSLAPVEDLDGDGLPELLVGCEATCGNTTDDEEGSGRLYLALGADLAAGGFSAAALQSGEGSSAELPAIEGWEGGAAGDHFGNALAAGDFNGDGHPDVAVVALDADNSAGRLLYLWSIDTLFDQDGDGYIAYPGASDAATLEHESGVVVYTGDCDDNDVEVHPGAGESCDERDEDCDGVVDEGVTTAYYRDDDGDGFGYPYTLSGDAPDEVNGDDAPDVIDACSAPAGRVANADDCDDARDSVFPGAAETCDGLRNDCSSGAVGDVPGDEEDLDGDRQMACAGDCDDQDPQTYAGSLEACDAIDNDCDDALPDDEADLDGDGWVACYDAAGPLSRQGDCDDQNPCRHPPDPDATPVPACLEDPTWSYTPVSGHDPQDLDCDDDHFSATFEDEDTFEATAGCLAVRTRSAVLPLLPSLLYLYAAKRRRRG